jgi:hypothetical protein
MQAAVAEKEVLHVWWALHGDDERESGTSFPNSQVGEAQAEALVEQLKWQADVHRIKVEVWRVKPGTSASCLSLKTWSRKDSGWEAES